MSSCISTFSNIGADFATKFQAALKTGQEKEIKAASQAASSNRLKAVALTAAAVALAILGVAFCATGAGTGFGIFLLLVSAPMLYVGVNSYNVLTNAKSLVENMRTKQPQQRIDSAQLKKELCKNTFGFEWVIDHRMDNA